MSQKLKEKAVSAEAQAASLGSRSQATDGDLSKFDDRIRRALSAAAEKKALDTTVLDLRGIASFTIPINVNITDPNFVRASDLDVSLALVNFHSKDIRIELFAPDGSSIAFISSATEAKHKERRMTVVDLVSLKDRFTLPVAYYHSVAFSPDGKTLAVSSDQRIALWEVASGEAISAWPTTPATSVITVRTAQPSMNRRRRFMAV